MLSDEVVLRFRESFFSRRASGGERGGLEWVVKMW